MNYNCPNCGQKDCLEKMWTDDDIRRERTVVTICKHCGDKDTIIYSYTTLIGMWQVEKMVEKARSKRGAR